MRAGLVVLHRVGAGRGEVLRGAAQRAGHVLVGELREVGLFLDVVERAPARLGGCELHALACELRVEVARVSLRTHLWLEGGHDLKYTNKKNDHSQHTQYLDALCCFIPLPESGR